MLDHIEVDTHGQSDDYNGYEELHGEMETHKIHIRIHHDRSYQHQSYAKLEVWRNVQQEWTDVVVKLAGEIIGSVYDVASELRLVAAEVLT